jgi:N-acetylglucosaminylphosphatidylinositol deacetylase
MTSTWDPDDVAETLSQTFISHTASPINIDVLITFDPQGVSSHANHISLYYGALHWLRKVDSTEATVAVYSLTTTNIVRKYISLLDAPFSILSAALLKSSCISRDHYPDRLLFLSGVSGYRKAQKAMTNGHVSQMLWFRWAYIGLSRYISLNDLTRQYHPASSGH